MGKPFPLLKHAVILIDHQTNTKKLVANIISNQLEGFDTFGIKNVGVFSEHRIEAFIEEEELHDLKIITKQTQQSLKSMSSGERKKALLNYLLNQHLEVLILVNPYDNLDVKTQSEFKLEFKKLGSSISLIQILSRVQDILPITSIFYGYNNKTLTKYADKKECLEAYLSSKIKFRSTIPPPIRPYTIEIENLVEFKNVSISFVGQRVLNCIDWTIKKGEFWQLIGPNGSGKTTLLNLITGDSHKGYGQNITLFGKKKGSGESVWDIKNLIGYFTPAMTDRFKGYHTLENMLISGLYDSIGLYQKPNSTEIQLAHSWLKLIQLESKKDQYFHQLSVGEKRLLMMARAMVKHPPLLILDEPTTGLDDNSVSFCIALVNKFAQEGDSTIIFVSHRPEKELFPKQVLELLPDKKGSSGKIKS